MHCYKTIWVIGGSSGIGAATAIALAKRALAETIIISGRREAELLKVTESCKGLNSKVHVVPLPMDVTNPVDTQVTYAGIKSAYGVPDAIVYSSGVIQRSLALDTTEAVDRQILEVNYFGATSLARCVVPDMATRGSGNFLVVSSIAGKIGTPMRSSYAASKHAIHGYFDCLRAEVHGHGVQVSVVCPGYIQTNATMKALTGDGAVHGKADKALANGMPVEECASTLIKVLQKETDEMIISHAKEKIAVLLSRISPRLFRKIARGLQKIE